jgi:hypothetical protein
MAEHDNPVIETLEQVDGLDAAFSVRARQWARNHRYTTIDAEDYQQSLWEAFLRLAETEPARARDLLGDGYQAAATWAARQREVLGRELRERTREARTVRCPDGELSEEEWLAVRAGVARDRGAEAVDIDIYTSSLPGTERAIATALLCGWTRGELREKRGYGRHTVQRVAVELAEMLAA